MHAIASGVDGFLYPAFRDSDVILTGEKGLVGGRLADHGFGLLLGLTRRIAAALRYGPKGWSHREELRRQEVELEGLTMGVVGFGGTGKEIARVAAAFGMRVIAVDVEPDVEPTAEVPEVWGLRTASTNCCRRRTSSPSGLPLTSATRGIFGERALAR